MIRSYSLMMAMILIIITNSLEGILLTAHASATTTVTIDCYSYHYHCALRIRVIITTSTTVEFLPVSLRYSYACHVYNLKQGHRG